MSTATFSAPPSTTVTTTSTFSAPSSTFSGPPSTFSAPPSTFSGPLSTSATSKLDGITVSFSNCSCYAGLKWDGTEDLDLSCVVYSQFGDMIDAAYFKNLSLFDGVITHSGDKKDGILHGYDEEITLSLNKLDESIGRFVYVIVNSPKKNIDIKAQLYIGDGDKEGGRVIKQYATDSSGWKGKSGFLAGVFVREAPPSREWVWQTIAEGIEASTFKGITPLIETNLKQQVDPKILAMRPRDAGKKFNLQKTEIYGIPKGIEKVVMGLGWDTKCDVDAHCYTFDKNLSPVGHVSYRDLQDPGIRHTGDNVTGDGAGDDERIIITFDEIEKGVEHLLFMVQIYNGASNFSAVKGCYCRMVTYPEDQELCRYTLNRSGSEGIKCCMCVISRSVFGWAATVVGEESNYAPGAILSSALGRIFEVSLTIISGRSLDAKDTNGKSDPFIKVYYPEFSIQGVTSESHEETKVIKKTLNPKWDFKCKNFCLRKDSSTMSKSIIFKCFDKDRFSKDDPMGIAKLPIEKILFQADGEPHVEEIQLEENGSAWISVSFTANLFYL